MNCYRYTHTSAVVKRLTVRYPTVHGTIRFQLDSFFFLFFFKSKMYIIRNKFTEQKRSLYCQGCFGIMTGFHFLYEANKSSFANITALTVEC